jgi:hypothetical protein
MAKNASPGWAAIAMTFADADASASRFPELGRPGMGLGFSWSPATEEATVPRLKSFRKLRRVE